ncbi:MAG: PD-(D/E)XK nuclease family protein, partial [Actinomycetota bacterium]|nr:PD-(D/E)XK nuclease family protein [Actinomycetota bacterium]
RRAALADERRVFEAACSRATGRLLGTAAPAPGVLLSRFVEAWPRRAGQLPDAPGPVSVPRATTVNPVPVFPDGHLHLSASALDTYDDCPLRYSYQYVLRVRDDAGVRADLGTLVHRVLAQFLDPDKSDRPPDDRPPRTRDALLALARELWVDDIARYRPQVEEARRLYFEMLERWWEAEGDGPGAPEVLAVERRFDIEVGGHRLTGSIDRIDRAGDGHGIRIVDYKTGKSEPPAGTMPDNLQLAVYHLAATRDPGLMALGPPTELRLLFLRTMHQYEQPVIANHAGATEARVLAAAERIRDEQFDPSVDANCRICPFHRLCPMQEEGREVAAGDMAG